MRDERGRGHEEGAATTDERGIGATAVVVPSCRALYLLVHVGESATVNPEEGETDLFFLHLKKRCLDLFLWQEWISRTFPSLTFSRQILYAHEIFAFHP